ncbi:lysylphosphatidylglycerol synthase transmembrane domain-containing protein [Pseudodesulfovibrio portus]|uniref:Flippase-like domain-containing protein n=1 Tax=Pseudodesulfovibrio portus TaxID=231439 RepID=A0ABN6RS60_9BACT|nr:lysylphosphatidylglycerol synthase domain-containing protein [Pseudodesulfovibrio portus]BDQ32900.1 hypothetical protein JCM14722_04420 [Pseudodesulfovibrio portus]
MLNSRSVVLQVLKVAFVVAIFAYLLASGKLDIGQFEVAAIQWDLFLVSIALVATTMLLLMIRYWYVVRSNQIPLNLSEAFRIGFVAFFFTNCAFGALSGEIVRMTYTAPYAEKKSRVLNAILFDRFIGVLSLSTLSLIGLAFNRSLIHAPWFFIATGAIFLFSSFAWQALISICSLSYLGHKWGVLTSYAFMVVIAASGFLLFAGDDGLLSHHWGRYVGIAMLLSFLVYVPILLAMIRRVKNSPDWQIEAPVNRWRLLVARVESVLHSCMQFVSRFKVLAIALGMALIAHFLYVLALLFIGMALAGNMGFHVAQGLLAAPMTFLMNLFPFPGAGAGVNEASYGFFMETLAGVDITTAVSSYFFFRCILILLSLVGAPLFVLRGKNSSQLAAKIAMSNGGDECE